MWRVGLIAPDAGVRRARQSRQVLRPQFLRTGLEVLLSQLDAIYLSICFRATCYAGYTLGRREIEGLLCL